jgi:hypothetical protein
VRRLFKVVKKPDGSLKEAIPACRVSDRPIALPAARRSSARRIIGKSIAVKDAIEQEFV